MAALANNWSELAQTGRYGLELFLHLQVPGQLRGKETQMRRHIHRDYNNIHLLTSHPVVSLFIGMVSISGVENQRNSISLTTGEC